MKKRFPHSAGLGGMMTDADKAIGFDGKNYSYGLNIVTDINGSKKINIKSLYDIGYSGAPGNNKLIGFVGDHINQTGYYFFHNSNGNHQIVRHEIQGGDKDILIESSSLNFNSGRMIHGVCIDGKYLIYTDAIKSGNYDIDGNGVKFIDIERMFLKGKKLEYDAAFGEGAFQVGNNYYLTVTDLNGAILVPTTIVYTASGLPFGNQLQSLATLITTGGYNVTATAVVGNNKLIVKSDNVGERIIITSDNMDVLLYPTNHYPEFSGANSLWEDKIIGLYRPNPFGVLEPSYSYDSTIPNLASAFVGKPLKFRYRYIFRDGFKGKWSVCSYVPSNITAESVNSEYINDERYNTIKLKLNDELLESGFWRSIIGNVEIAYQIEENGLWRSYGLTDVSEWGITYSLANKLRRDIIDNGAGSIIASDESSSPDTQVLGLFSNIPVNSISIEGITTEEGNSLILGGNSYPYAFPDYIDVVISYINSFVLSPPFLGGGPPPDQEQNSRKLKAGGVYSAGISFEDFEGRTTPIKKIGTIEIPLDVFHTGVQYIPSISLGGIPPEWAYRYKIYLTKDQKRKNYFQELCSSVVYWKVTDGVFSSTTYGAGDATYVAFVINKGFEDNDINKKFDNSKRYFIPENGDRITIFDTSGGIVYDYEISGYNLTWPTGTSTVDRFSIFVKFDPLQPNFIPLLDFIIEVYKPSKVEDEFYYEVPIVSKIQDYGLPTRNYGPPVDFIFGDTWVWKLKNNNSAGSAFFEVETKALYYKENTDSILDDFGRSNFQDDLTKPYNLFTEIRASDFYYGKRNQIPNFRVSERIFVDDEIGSIQRLLFLKSICLIIGSRGSRVIYVNKKDIISADGNTLSVKAESVLNLGNTAFKYGSSHPHSIVRSEDYIYGFDSNTGTPWFYSIGGGIEPIPGGNVKLFKDYSTKFATDIIIGGYDGYYDMYYLTLKNVGITMGFSVVNKWWEGYYSFVPDYYSRIGVFTYSSKSGNIYEHNKESVTSYNNFYGNVYDSLIYLPCNPDPYYTKIFWSVVLDGSLWSAPVATTDLGYARGYRVISLKSIMAFIWLIYQGMGTTHSF